MGHLVLQPKCGIPPSVSTYSSLLPFFPVPVGKQVGGYYSPEEEFDAQEMEVRAGQRRTTVLDAPEESDILQHHVSIDAALTTATTDSSNTKNSHAIYSAFVHNISDTKCSLH